MAIELINRNNFLPTKIPTRVSAEKVNEVIEKVNELETAINTDFPSTVAAAAATDALIIDGATTDHTGDALIDIDADVDVNNANNAFNAINVNYDISVALGAAEIATGVKVTGDALASDVDTSAIIGFAADLTSPTTSRADVVGVLVGIDSVRTTADTDSGFMVGFTGTMNQASAGTYGLRVGSAGFTHTAGTFWGAYINVGHEATAGSAIAIEIDANSTSTANSKYGLMISKDLTNATAAGALAATNEALTIGQTVASSALASGAVTAANNLAYIAKSNSNAVATADVYGGSNLVLTYSATTTGTGTATNSASALTIDYNLTETAGTLTNTSFNVAYIDFDTTGTPVFDNGTYNMILIDVDTAASVAASATATINGLKVDFSGTTVTDGDLTLAGVSVTLPAYGTSTQYGVFATDGTYQAFLIRNQAAGYFNNGTQTLTICNATSHLSAATALITDMPVTAPGAGFDTANGVKIIPYGKHGVAGAFVTEFYLDLQVAAVSSSTTDLDIIGEAGGGAAYIGQITAALNGTVVAIEMVCLEAPATGVTDIDLYAVTENTGAYDASVTALTNTALITAGGAWTNGMVKGATAVPAADQYLYLVGGAAGTAGAYSAGKFLIRVFGI